MQSCHKLLHLICVFISVEASKVPHIVDEVEFTLWLAVIFLDVAVTEHVSGNKWRFVNFLTDLYPVNCAEPRMEFDLSNTLRSHQGIFVEKVAQQVTKDELAISVVRNLYVSKVWLHF